MTQQKGVRLKQNLPPQCREYLRQPSRIEAFYASVDEHIPTDKELAKRWAKNRTARTVRICETLIRAFKVTHPGRTILRDNLEEVFKFRDYAVHPPARFREPVMHPDPGVAWNGALFHLELGSNYLLSCGVEHHQTVPPCASS